MSGVYCELREPDGSPFDILTDIISLDAVVAFNTVGSLSLTLPDMMDVRRFRRDMQLKVFHETPGYAPIQFGNTTFLLNKVTRRNDTIILSAPDINSVLANAIVAYTSETPYADKTQEESDISGIYIYFAIDDLMRAFVRENLSVEALDIERNNSFLSVENDRSLAPDGQKAASFANLMSTLQDLARQSEEKGTSLYFTLYPNGEDSYIFRVWSNQPNVDRSSTSAVPMVLLEENGDLQDVEEVYDWSEEGNVVYGLGGGSGSQRVNTFRTNDVSLRGGPFSRREFTHDMPDVDNLDVGNLDWVEGELGAALIGKRPRVRISAKLNDGGTYVFGQDFSFGDKISIVTGFNFYRQFDVYISASRLNYQDGKASYQVSLTQVDFL